MIWQMTHAVQQKTTTTNDDDNDDDDDDHYPKPYSKIHNNLVRSTVWRGCFTSFTVGIFDILCSCSLTLTTTNSVAADVLGLVMTLNS